MMLKRFKTKIALVVMAAVAVMALAAVGVAMADSHETTPNTTEETQTPTPTPTPKPRDEIIVKAAAILGISPEALEQALNQAHQEVKREQIDARIALHLAKMVKNGRLTQAQADELMAWIKDRPDFLANPVEFWSHLGGNSEKPARPEVKERKEEMKERAKELKEKAQEHWEDEGQHDDEDNDD